MSVNQLDLSVAMLAVVVILTASFGEWIEVRFGPLGMFTLRPVAAFVGLWAVCPPASCVATVGGPALLMFAGLLPIFVVRLLAGRSTWRKAFTLAGIDACAFWIGYLTYLAAGRWLPPSLGATVPVDLAVRATSFAAFWIAEMAMQALVLNLSEGTRYASVLRHLAKHAWAHVLVLVVAAIGLSWFGSIGLRWFGPNLGPVFMGLAAVTLIEAYYPWKLYGEQNGILYTSLQVMAQAVDLKDPYTSNHSQRVAQYAVRIARAMDLREDEVERIRIGGLMHDLGKIGISGRIIRKPGKLSPDEQALMKRHSIVSADIIRHLEILGESAKMVRYHHEHWDGSGYPDGLKGGEIPLGSRIILAADAFDALSTDRPYRKGASRTEALAVIRKHSGTQFDPIVVEVLERIVHLF